MGTQNKLGRRVIRETRSQHSSPGGCYLRNARCGHDWLGRPTCAGVGLDSASPILEASRRASLRPSAPLRSKPRRRPAADKPATSQRQAVTDKTGARGDRA